MALRKASRSIAMSRALSRFITWADDAPEGGGDYAAHSLIALLRARLAMTQEQLARRCGLPQSHIAKIEKGKVDLQLGTLRRIFKALFCELVLSPKPQRDLDGIILEQARKAARARVSRVAGTMVMEKQRPEEDALEEMVGAEAERLVEKRSPEIWEV